MGLYGYAGTAETKEENGMTINLIKWLQEERKLDGALLAHMGVKETRHPGLGEAVAFPYRVNGEVSAAKFRTHDKRFSSTKGVSRPLYNIDALAVDEDQPIVITEGEIDCLTVMQAGWARAVSLPDGWTEQGNKTESLLSAEAGLRSSPFVIVAGDADSAGESLPRVVANILKGHDVRTVTWPNGCKDANDVLMMFGEGEVAACLNKAKRVDPPGGFITGLSDLPPLSARRVMRTGVRWVDKRLAFEAGAMSVGTGTPGMGKSTLVTWVMHALTANENVRCGMMAFETHPHRTRDHLSRLETGKPFSELSDDQARGFLSRMDNRFRIVHRTYEGASGHNLGWLEKMVYTLAVRDQCKIIVIDPWNELEHLPEAGESLTNYVNFALQQIRQWAEHLETHICLIAHPKKMDMGQKPRPPLGYDVADSAAFANKPSLGFTIHGEKNENGLIINQLHTWKVRDVQLYGIDKGSTECFFDKDRMDYTAMQVGE
jgi:twinkle protein